MPVSPDSIRSSVVLPAPLRPASVMRSRRSSLNDTPLNRGFPAMSLSSALAITTAMSGSRLRVAREGPVVRFGMPARTTDAKDRPGPKAPGGSVRPRPSRGLLGGCRGADRRRSARVARAAGARDDQGDAHDEHERAAANRGPSDLVKERDVGARADVGVDSGGAV